MLRLFNYSRTLEELDGMDLARLNRALEAQQIEAAWKRWRDPQEKKRMADGKVVSELFGLLTDEEFERVTGKKRKR